jgi:hypothetical protein
MTIEFPIETPVANVVKFVNCCTGQEIFFRGSVPFPNGTVIRYTGSEPFPGFGGSLEPASDEFTTCYTIFSEYQDQIPGYPPIAAAIISLSETAGCLDPKCFCPRDVSQCYMLIPCTGEEPIITSNLDFDEYTYSFITVDSLNYNGCAYIVPLSYTDCEEDDSNAEPVPEVPCECDLTCYYVSNANGFFYVDSENTLQNVSPVNASPYAKVCSKIPPVVESNSVNPQVIELGLCEDDECPQLCFKLINCENTDLVIYTNSNSLLPYVYGPNKIVKILGKEGCWTASELDPDEECDCPIDITVTSSYVSCLECIGIKAYKLVSCEGNSTIYTYLNLEAYINQVVKLDCGCYVVEQINYAPPNPQVVKLEDIFPNCTSCLRTHWKLTDCAGDAKPVITYTDLSLYINKVIKVEGCTECWLVEPTEEYLNAIDVTVTDDYDDCEECSIPTVCECTKVTNLNSTSKIYSYFDCDNIFRQIELQPGESSEKICAIRWVAENLYCECIKFTQGDDVSYAVLLEDVFNLNKPVYRLCTDAGCIFIYWSGTNWVGGINLGSTEILVILQNSSSQFCPYGIWSEVDVEGSRPTLGDPISEKTITSEECDLQTCRCVNVGITNPKSNETFQLNVWAITPQGYPIFTAEGYPFLIYNDECTNCGIQGCWTFSEDYGFQLCSVDSTCPTGIWNFPIQATKVVITECPVTPSEFTVYDHFETFGECKFGTCPPPVFKNNRTVKPGYNTPNCNPEEYDKITCRFADVMYKSVLEKRYGISNCCPEDDEKWLMKKELIDLQALKDPNYKCPACPCSCNSGKSYSTCNCGN